jgi:methionyl-tRNA synthetase
LELLPSDLWRWYLIANAPEGSDTAFTWEQFQSAVNRDLADVLGNFVNRILKFNEAKFGGVVPEGGELGELEFELARNLSAQIDDIATNLDQLEFRKAAQGLRALWVLGNEYLQVAAPWTVIKTDPNKAAMIVRTAINLVALYAKVSAPFIPATATLMAKAVGLDDEKTWPTSGQNWMSLLLDALPRGQAVTVPDVLFKKIEDEQVAEWTARFGGSDEA